MRSGGVRRRGGGHDEGEVGCKNARYVIQAASTTFVRKKISVSLLRLLNATFIAFCFLTNHAMVGASPIGIGTASRRNTLSPFDIGAIKVRGGGRVPTGIRRPRIRPQKETGPDLEEIVEANVTGKIKISKKSALTWIGVAAVASLIFIEYAENIAAYCSSLKPDWFDMELFKAKLLERLTDVNENGGVRGRILYVAFFILWGMFGLTTVPVESAAGMAFGWKAVYLNAAGKMLASLAAYTMGRLFLEDHVVSKLEDNEIFGLVEKSVGKKPYRTSIIVRLGPFPELVKNVGLSVLPPVGFGIFTLATFTQVFPFTLLWTWLGCDSVARMRDDTLPANKLLAAILLGVTIFGIFGAPAMIGLWVRDMKLEHDKAV